MAVTRPFAFNTGSTIPGTTQVGNLAIGVDAYDYSEQPGGVRWWNGPDEELGYVIAHETLTGDQPNPLNIPAFLGFWRTEGFNESLFISLSEWVSNKDNDPQIFATGDDAKIWLNNNGYWTSFGESPQPENLDNPIITENSEYIEVGNGYYLMFVDSTPIATPTPTASLAVTPTPTPQPVTGYSFNLVELPYDFPTSGNTIMNNEVGVQSGSTNPNALSTSSRGLYWNAIDSDGIDRTSYFSEFTGQSITITISQTGSTAIYSGDSDSLKQWVTSPTESGFVFGTGIGVPPSVNPSGTATLVQSATTEWNYGIPVYISVTINTPEVTPTSTPTPTPTPTITPTITPVTGFTITINQVGNDVVMSATGTLNTTDLTLVSAGDGPFGGGGIGVSTATFILGGVGGTYDQYSGFTTTPSNFGTGGGLPPSSSSGDIMGVVINNIPPYLLVVPNGYVSGTLISGSQTFNNQTLSGMGLTDGTYTYTWGSGANSDSIQVVIGGSSPSPTPTPTPTQVSTTGFTVTISQVGNDVIWSGSGSLNINDLTFSQTSTMTAGNSTTMGIWATGPLTPTNSDFYAGVTVYPDSIGPGPSASPTSGGDDILGILPGGSGRTLLVPEGYVSGTFFTTTTTYGNNTITGMGLTSGVYVYSWGLGANADSLTLIIE